MGLFSPYTWEFILKLRHCNEKTSQNYQVLENCQWKIPAIPRFYKKVNAAT